MANDITQRVLQGALGTKRAVKLINIVSDATDNAPIVSFDPVNNPCGDFECFGGITNPNTAGGNWEHTNECNWAGIRW